MADARASPGGARRLFDVRPGLRAGVALVSGPGKRHHLIGMADCDMENQIEICSLENKINQQLSKRTGQF